MNPVRSEVRPRKALSDRAARLWLLSVLLVGLAIRIPLLGLLGSPDMDIWKTWAYGTVKAGPTQIYKLGLKKGQQTPPLDIAHISKALNGQLVPRGIKYRDHRFYPDYPPATFYLLWVVAASYHNWVSPDFEDGPSLNVAIKLLPLLAELATTLLLWWLVRRVPPDSELVNNRADAEINATGEGISNSPDYETAHRPSRTFAVEVAAIATAASYWLNPAVLAGGTLLAYLDSLYSLALVIACGAMLRSRFSFAWIAWGLALAIKPQSLLLLPGLLVLSLWRGPKRLMGYVLAAGATLLAVALPVIFSGNTLAMIAGISMNARDDYLSGYQVNLWWIVSYLFQAISGGGPGVVTEPQLITDFTRRFATYVPLFGYILFVTVGLLLCILWLLNSTTPRRKRVRSDVTGTNRYALTLNTNKGIDGEGVILLALLLYAGTMLLQGSHENHLLGAVPLFALGIGWKLAVEERVPHKYPLTWLYALVSLVVCLNMLIFFGFGTGLPNPFPRALLGFDTSVMLAIVNVFTFVFFIYVWIRLLLNGRGRNKPGDTQQAQANLPAGIMGAIVIR